MEPAKRNLVAAALHLPLQALLLLVAVIMVGALSGASMADQVMYPGGSLTSGQSLSISNYFLTMQSDCNLVLYDGGRAVWATGTNGRGTNCRVTWQRNANLVLFTGAGTKIWTSNTARTGGNYALVLQRDRNLVIYGPNIWATGTNTAGANVSINLPKDVAVLPTTTHGGDVVSIGGRKANPGGLIASVVSNDDD